MQILEAELEQKCKKLAEAKGCIFLKIQGTKGYPDRLLIAPTGKVMFLEFKRPMGVVSAMQVYAMEKLLKLNVRVQIIRSVEVFQKQLESLL